MTIPALPNNPPLPAAREGASSFSRTETLPSSTAAVSPAAPPDTGSQTGETRAALEAATGQLQKAADSSRAELQFSIDDTLNQVVVKVIDTRDGRLLRQIPSEDALVFARRLQEGRATLIDLRA
jgi:flagellar protein FlaG